MKKIEKLKKKKKWKTWENKKKQKMKTFLLKTIITKSDQKDAGATFVRIRNSHEGNVQFLQKRQKGQKKKKVQKQIKK